MGRIFTSHDRAGAATLSSRLGLAVDAIEVPEQFDFWGYVVDALTHGARIDYLVCDEAQFYTPVQVEQLARIADELQIDVFASSPTSVPACFPARPAWSSWPTGCTAARAQAAALSPDVLPFG